MKKSFITRLFALVLCLAMLATVTPIFAAAEITITQVDITGVTEPVDGQAINCDFSVENVGLTKAAKGDWANITDDYWMHDGFLFEAGKQYIFFAYMDVLPGYAWPSRLSGNVTATMNGQTAEIGGVDKKEYKHVSYTFTCAEAPGANVIDKIEITNADITPYIGEDAANYLDYTLPENCHYSVETNVWYDEDTGNYLPTAERVFVSGNTYAHAWNLVADEGYTFAATATVTVNGSSAFVDTAWTKSSVDGTKFEVWTPLTAAVEKPAVNVIDKIEIDGFCDAVVGGKAGDYIHLTLPEDAPYHFDGDPWWVEDAENEALRSDDTFEAGKAYTLGGWLVADEGYIFAENPEVLLNGGDYPVDEIYTKRDDTDADCFHVWSEPAEAVELNVIDKIEINGFCDAVVGGKAGDFIHLTLPEDAPYRIGDGSLYWHNDTDDMDVLSTDMFEKGKSYSLRGMLAVDEGYVFADKPIVLLNGGDFAVGEDYTHTDVFDAHWFYFGGESKEAVEKPAANVINKIEINGFCDAVVGGKAGDHLGFALPDDCHYTVSKVRWYYLPIESDEEFSGMNDEDVFETETLYYAEYILLPDEGYVFAKDAAATINGSAEQVGAAFLSGDGSFSIFTKQTECVAAPEKLLGDANGDKSVDMKDVLAIRKVIANLGGEINEVAADVNRDNSVDMKDVLLIRKFIAKLIESF